MILQVENAELCDLTKVCKLTQKAEMNVIPAGLCRFHLFRKKKRAEDSGKKPVCR